MEGRVSERSVLPCLATTAERPGSIHPPLRASPTLAGWVDVTQAVGMDIASIKSKVVELAKCHARALLTTFDDVGKEETQVEGG